MRPGTPNVTSAPEFKTQGRVRAASQPPVKTPATSPTAPNPPEVPSSPKKRQGGWFQQKVSQDELLTYCARGVRASSLDLAPNRQIDEECFRMTHAYEYDGVVVKMVAPVVFAWIRSLCKYSEVSWRQGFSGSFYCSPTAGKSGASFFRSADERFMLKSVSEAEARVVRELLPSLHEHFKACPSSLLNKPLGIFVIEAHGTVKSFVALQNVCAPRAPLHRLFDLKGSTQGRVASSDEYKKGVPLLKDIDWILSTNKIKVPASQFEQVSGSIVQDVKYLNSQGVMDYSLFIGWCKEGGLKNNPGVNVVTVAATDTFYVGIIDFLQKYNTSKKIARVAKGIVNDPTTLSTVPPKEYAERFERFLMEKVFEKVASSNPPAYKARQLSTAAPRKIDLTAVRATGRPALRATPAPLSQPQKQAAPSQPADKSSAAKPKKTNATTTSVKAPSAKTTAKASTKPLEKDKKRRR